MMKATKKPKPVVPPKSGTKPKPVKNTRIVKETSKVFPGSF